MNVLRFWLVQSALFPLVGIALWISTHNDKTEMIETMSDVCAFFKVQNWRQLWIGWRMQMPEWERCLQLQDGVWTPHIYGHIIKGKTSKFWNIKMTTIQSLSTDDTTVPQNTNGTLSYIETKFKKKTEKPSKNWWRVLWIERKNTTPSVLQLINYWSFIDRFLSFIFCIYFIFWSLIDRLPN